MLPPVVMTTPFVAAVAGLAVQQQDLVHAGAGLALDLAVQLHEGHAAPLGQLRAQCRLAGAAQAHQGDALLSALRVGQSEGGAQQRMGPVQLRVVQPGEQAQQARERRERRVLQQVQQGDVQGAGRGLERVDRHIALASLHIRQEALGQARVGRQLPARHAPAGSPGAHARPQVGDRGTGFGVHHGLHRASGAESLRWINIAIYFLTIDCQAVYCM
jgi:hypothetical protein